MKPQIQRLHKYLIDLHISGKACVFISMSGHVDQYGFEVCDSVKRYGLKLYTNQFYILNREDSKGWLSYIDKRNWKEFVDEIIEDIEFALSEREAKIAQAQAEDEARERKRYEELKSKYEA